jgi:hypothetical protein
MMDTRTMWLWAWRIGMVAFILCMAAIFTLAALSASASKETAPPWGQETNTTAPATFYPGVDRGDNITVNISCPSGMVWFKTDLLYISSSNDTLANNGAYVQKLNFWIVAANSDRFSIVFNWNDAPYYCYTLNIERAADAKDRQISELQSRIQDLTAQLGKITVLNITNITEIHHNETFQNITVVNGTDFNASYLETNLSRLGAQLQDLGELLDNLSAENQTTYIYSNTTVHVLEEWAGINDTLANISELRTRLSLEENKTAPAPYNDSGLRAQVQDLSKVTNTTEYINRTEVFDPMGPGLSAAAGAAFGAAGPVAIILATRRKNEKSLTPLPPPEAIEDDREAP